MREDPEWFASVNPVYAAFQNGILPCSGGLDQQPAKFMPLMAILQSAYNAETSFSKVEQDREEALVAESQATTSRPTTARPLR